jgi:microcystin degradation protein MlrC
VLKKHEHPVFVSDSGDNPTAGSTGDATELLERILETMETADKLPTPLLYSGFYDASAAKACVKAGIGVELDLTIGGNWDTINGKKIPLKVKVEKIAQSYGPFSSDLVLVSHKNLRLVITSRHIGFGDPNLLPALMVKPEEYCLVAVKLGYLEPCFRKIAGRAIMATTRGCSNQLFETIPFRNIIRPLFPIDKDMDFSPY